VSISAKVLADSVNPKGERLTTLEVTMPRIILAEFNTHRAFSRNSASSRAIPVQKQLARIREDPFVPEAFPINQSGMSASEYVTKESDPGRYSDLAYHWRVACDAAMSAAVDLSVAGVHKQIANRVLEPFMWHTVIVSATEWENFFQLRISEHAQPEMRETAHAMMHAIGSGMPNALEPGEWHLPLIGAEDADLQLSDQIKSSAARVAAVSYDRHTDRDLDKERARFELLRTNRHLSPFEHVAHAMDDESTWANYTGWRQARWFVERDLEIA
jgi:thymidylate synthase ThyX